MNNFEDYANYFSAGLKVGVGIPMANAGVFRDWAVISEIDEDFVSLQLSRDQLPLKVSLHVGQILELRGGKDDSGYSCRAIIVAESPGREILLRLIGDIVSDELREFYRIEAFLPIKYYISPEQNVEVLKQEWLRRREQRQIIEAERKQKEWDSKHLRGSAELPAERRLKQAVDDQGEDGELVEDQEQFEDVGPVEDAGQGEDVDPWDTIIPLAANISGGGVRITTHQHLENGVYVLLEILVPMPRRIVDIVARVMSANRNYAAGEDHEYYNIGLQFVFIDEWDRDAILKHVSNIQLKRIRQLREQFIFRDGLDTEEEGQEEATGFRWSSLFMWLGYAVVFMMFIILLSSYFRHYAKDRPKSEIEEMFEGGIRKYLEGSK